MLFQALVSKRMVHKNKIEKRKKEDERRRRWTKKKTQINCTGWQMLHVQWWICISQRKKEAVTAKNMKRKKNMFYSTPKYSIISTKRVLTIHIFAIYLYAYSACTSTYWALTHTHTHTSMHTGYFITIYCMECDTYAHFFC